MHELVFSREPLYDPKYIFVLFVILISEKNFSLTINFGVA